MSTEHEIKKSTELITFLQVYIKNNVKQSFNDISFGVEVLVKELLNILEDANYENLNDMHFNFPAIDLLDRNQGVAIQVTTTANKKKVDNTLAVYEKNKMIYTELIILGFVSSTRPKTDKARVVDIQYLLSKIKSATHEKIMKVNLVLQRELPINRLSIFQDKHCLEVVLSVLNRSAIRDRGHQEGSYEDMVIGLKEIKEVLCTGKLKGKTYTSKSLYEYSEKNQLQLEAIEFEISKIIQIYNIEKNKSGLNCIFIDDQKMNEIDVSKKEIIKMANNLAGANDIKTRITSN